MVATIPPLLVAKPTPSMPLRYGLLQAAVGPLDLPVHGRNGGVRYWETMCGGGALYEIECLDEQGTKEFTATMRQVIGAPFMVTATFTCGVVGFTQEEFDTLAVQKLLSVEQSQVETALSTGTFGASPALFGAGVVTVTGGGTTTTEVLSELERALYCTSQYGPPGYVHVPIPVFNDMKERHLIVFDGTRWRTAMGTVVSAGCYAGNEPDGDAPADGTFWMYMTGQTTVWRTPDSEIQVAPVAGSLNRTTNQQLLLAEREYVVTYECAVYAKPVTLWAP